MAISRAARRAPRAAGNPSRARLYEFVARAAGSTAAGSRVLDAGAGDLLYADLWRHTRYESADIAQLPEQHRNFDYICDLASIPVESARFDAVVLTQVLEHIADPPAVLTELCRVLKPGGRLWLSAPLFYEQHEIPYDFHRYTEFGLGHHLQGAGFVVEEIDWLEGYFGTLAYQARTAARYLPRRASSYGGGLSGSLLAAVAWPASLTSMLAAELFGALELRFKVTTSGYPKNFTAIARKPVEGVHAA